MKAIKYNSVDPWQYFYLWHICLHCGTTGSDHLLSIVTYEEVKYTMNNYQTMHWDDQPEFILIYPGISVW